jgi:hypothetical protein
MIRSFFILISRWQVFQPAAPSEIADIYHADDFTNAGCAMQNGLREPAMLPFDLTAESAIFKAEGFSQLKRG